MNFMGQAKQRGTFEQRKQIAIAVDSKIESQFGHYGRHVVSQLKRQRRIKTGNAAPQSPAIVPQQTSSDSHRQE